MAVKQRYYCMMNVIHSSHVFPVDGASLLHPNIWSRFPPKPPAVSGQSAERVEVGLRWLEDWAAKTVIMDAGKCMEKCEKTWAMTFRQDDLGDYEDCNVVIPSDCNDFWWFLFSSLDWWGKMWPKQKWTRAFAVEVSQTIHCVCHLCVSHEPGTCYHFFPRQKPTEVFFSPPRLAGFADSVLTQFTKMAATSLSSNTLGQVTVSWFRCWGGRCETWGIPLPSKELKHPILGKGESFSICLGRRYVSFQEGISVYDLLQ